MRLRIFKRGNKYYLQVKRGSSIALHTSDYDEALQRVKDLGIKKPPCPYCGSENVPSNRKFCSDSCRNNLKSDIMRYGMPRREILEAFDNKCCVCGCTDNLDVHHVDGKGTTIKPKDRNNNCDNLVVLCTSCHIKIHLKKSIANQKVTDHAAIDELDEVLKKAITKMNSVRELMDAKRKYIGCKIGCNLPSKVVKFSENQRETKKGFPV